jgi:outer membrane receptor protein involved in Fe transport
MVAVVAAIFSPAMAQSPVGADSESAPAVDQNGARLEEVVVTARKRSESLMQAPVDVQAVTADQLQNAHITDFYDLSTLTPDLDITVAFATVGATVNMRGLTNGFAANFIDQSIALNVDGATLSHGAFYRGALFDVEQIEVLKGPQNLFFGKSSDAGIVAVRTADPTSTWQSEITSNYEFDAGEFYESGWVSGPLTDQLGVRAAAFYDSIKGYFYNPNPENPNHRLPAGTTDGGRLTLKFDSESGLRMRLKIGGTQNNNNAPDGDLNQHTCPLAVAQGGFPYDDCKIDDILAGTPKPLPYLPQLNYNPFNAAAFAEGCPNFLCENGAGYQLTDTVNSLLDVDYDINKSLTLNSVTSWDFVKAQENAMNPGVELGAQYFEHEYGEELRLTSNWRDSWINFMAGGLYNRATVQNNLLLVLPGLQIPSVGTIGLYTYDNMALVNVTASGFGQLLLTPINNWELSIGARYTDMHKYFNSLVANNNYPSFFAPGPSGQDIGDVPYADRSIDEKNVSPEATVTWRPTGALTAYLSYKEGYKGPGFNADTVGTTFNASNVSPFSGETARGLEGGIKAQLLDRQLAVIVDGYRYNYDNLQVAFPDVTTSTVNVDNDARARVEGLELSGDYRPLQLTGWEFNAALDYNVSYYLSFPIAPCFAGQLASQGCIATAVGPHQSLTGRELSDAPLITGTFGAEYTRPIADSYKVSAGLSGKYSSSYYSSADAHPLSYQDGYVTLDANVHFGKQDGLWDLAVIGRNITNKIYMTGSESGPLVTPGIWADNYAFVNRPWELLVQLTVHPPIH